MANTNYSKTSSNYSNADQVPFREFFWVFQGLWSLESLRQGPWKTGHMDGAHEEMG